MITNGGSPRIAYKAHSAYGRFVQARWRVRWPGCRRRGCEGEAQMANSDLHIPDDEIRGAFDLAMTALVHWTKEGGGEPKVPLNGEPYLISTVAVLAETFRETMPASLFWRVAAYANRSFERRVQAAHLSKDSSYETGARCLLQWVRDNKSRFGQ
jgi:hypothetical protein